MEQIKKFFPFMPTKDDVTTLVKAILFYMFVPGIIPGVLGGDGEELDVFLVGVEKAVSTFTGEIIGIVYRADDVEDKLVMAPSGVRFTAEEIARAVYFQEKYYDTTVRDIDNNRVHITSVSL